MFYGVLIIFLLSKALKKVLVLWGTNLNQDSREDITDGIIEDANTFKFKYFRLWYSPLRFQLVCNLSLY